MELYEELERKFLVLDPTCVEGSEGTRLTQGYVFPDEVWAFRIRVTDQPDDAAVLTIKQRRPGVSRAEFETEMPIELAEDLLRGCDYVVEKTRYPLVANARLWVVDVFQEANAGLILAELELGDMDAPFTKPAWCGDEVTDDGRYYNESLAQSPHTSWEAM